MKELGITRGVVQDKNYILTSDGQLVATVNYPAVAQPNDTKFIAEAFKVANETNMMPREMVEINRELLEAGEAFVLAVKTKNGNLLGNAASLMEKIIARAKSDSK